MSIATIPINEFWRLSESGRPVEILDVRTPGEFARVHVAGAKSLPLDEMNAAVIAEQHRASGEPIYVICQSGGRAAEACRQLQDAGAASVYSIEGGTSAWEKMGLPVERGVTRVISLERQVRIAAGSLVLLGAVLAWLVHPAFLALPAFVGGGLMFSGITDTCGMGLLLAKMPWNR